MNPWRECTRIPQRIEDCIRLLDGQGHRPRKDTLGHLKSLSPAGQEALAEGDRFDAPMLEPEDPRTAAGESHRGSSMFAAAIVFVEGIDFRIPETVSAVVELLVQNIAFCGEIRLNGVDGPPDLFDCSGRSGGLIERPSVEQHVGGQVYD